MDMGDIFSGIFGDGFGDIFGGGRSRSSRSGPQRGSDMQMSMTISFEESMFGCKKELNIPVYEKCTECNGSGAKKGTSPEVCSYCNGTGQEKVTQQTPFGMISSARVCSHCRGEGKIIREKCPKCGGNGNVKINKTVSVEIPKGISSGQSIRKRGLGGAGSKGGPNGDLFIQINVTPSKTFVRQGNDLYIDVPISITQAVFGAEIKIPTIDGDYDYTLKPGTQPNASALIRGKGAYNVKNDKYRGNLNVTFKVQIPTELNKAQKEALAKFAEASGEPAPKKKSWFNK